MGFIWQSGWRFGLLVAIGLSSAVMAVAETPLQLPVLWTVDTKTFLESQASVADINGDGLDEIVAAGREELIALDGMGVELWRWRTKGRFMTYPAVYARAGTSALIFAADSSGWMSCVDGTGTERWHAQLDGPSSWSSSVVADLDGDGAPEVVQTDETGAVWAFRAESGERVWKTALKGMPVSPAVADLDGDGRPEVVVCTNAGLLVVL
ncbi:MAG: VCBS repeat-containing protein, partial [Candidatus Hydrogenedentes bacterium]|nr:VCBS repeat-containing protein [Candidatus Hydrogenedentota bacterium]